jgi:hypothetical protein
MQCNRDVNVFEPKESDMLFPPYITFRLVQLNDTPHLMSNSEIDSQVGLLIENAKKLGVKAKRKLKDAKARHDNLLERMREEHA